MPVPLPTSSLPITFRTPARGLSISRQTPLPLKDIQPTPINTSQPSHTSMSTHTVKKTPHYHLSLPDAYNAAASNNAAPSPHAGIHPVPIPRPCPSGKRSGAQESSTPTARPSQHPAPSDCPPLVDVQKCRRLTDSKAIAAAQAQLALHLWKTQDCTPAEAAYASGSALYAIRVPPPRQAFLGALAQAGLGVEEEGDGTRTSLKSASPEDDPGIPNMEIEAKSLSLEKALHKPGSRDSDLVGPSQKALGKRKRTGNDRGSNNDS
ncbi:uncharacterized protein SCHCODRAFT_02664108 [Schizophyllum commune H4-8]|nr:uncharacterized protein SCHCODRAFT_02664108 [Schizophyllum commune H4-8]KAI5896279.1 hypothetical protein SCHCODRAFT_02664108 [Schizophyllum commune H4-8]